MDEPDLTPAAVARTELRRLGILVDNLTNEQAVALWGRFLRAHIPSPPVPTGILPVNARAWAAAALTAGGFVAPDASASAPTWGMEGLTSTSEPSVCLSCAT